MGQQTGTPNKCRFYYFHARLSERLKSEEEETHETSAELAPLLIKRKPESYSAVLSTGMPSVSPPQKIKFCSTGQRDGKALGNPGIPGNSPLLLI